MSLRVFILLFDQSRQEGEFKRMKNDHFQGFFAVWVLSPPQVFGQFMAWITVNFDILLILCL